MARRILLSFLVEITPQIIKPEKGGNKDGRCY